MYCEICNICRSKMDGNKSTGWEWRNESMMLKVLMF